MSKLALDSLDLRGQSGTLSADVGGTGLGPQAFASYGPEEEAPQVTSILNVDLLRDTDGNGTGDVGLAGVDVTFTVDGVDSVITTDAAGRAQLSFLTENPLDTVSIQVPPHVVQADGNSAGLLPVSAASVFDEVTGTHNVDVTAGDEVTLGAAYFGVSASINILSRSNEMVNPESLILSAIGEGFPGVAAPASGTYDKRLHEPEYFWTFGDTRVVSALKKTCGIMDQADHAFGPVVTHTYDAPGVKSPQVTVTRWHNGYLLTAVASLNLTIQDQDVVFAGADTFFIDPDSDYTGAPAGAVGYPDFASAQGGLNGRTTPTRLMFRDGKIHTLTPSDQWRSTHLYDEPENRL